MARLVLPQFKQVDSDGSEIDRSLDLEDMDAAFGAVAKVLNGNLGPGNLANGMTLSAGVTVGAIPNAWREGASQVTFFAQGLQQAALGTSVLVPQQFILANIPAVGVWIPRRLTIVGSYEVENASDPAGAPKVTVSAPGYVLATEAVMKRVAPAVTQKKYGLLDGDANTTPEVSYSSVFVGSDFYKLDLVSADQSLNATGSDGHLLGGSYPDGSTFGLPNGKPIRVVFDRRVAVSSASLTCITPHLA